ncbi:c-type cytochrome [Sphingobium olei]
MMRKFSLFLPLIALAGPAAAQAPDAALGKRVFMRCMACHNVAANAPNKIGPNLYGIVGKKAAAIPGFRYSTALQKSGISWDVATLDKWLTRPSAVVPGTSMVFAGIGKPEERQALIAYLKKPTP